MLDSYRPGAVQIFAADFASSDGNRSIKPRSCDAIFTVQLKPIITANNAFELFELNEIDHHEQILRLG